MNDFIPADDANDNSPMDGEEFLRIQSDSFISRSSPLYYTDIHNKKVQKTMNKGNRIGF